MRPALVRVLGDLGITHVVGVPDNTSAPVFDALRLAGPPRLLTVTREGEAFAVASGLWLGGASPLVLIQNTGLLESGDALRGTATRMGVPLPIVVTARGWSGMVGAGVTADTPPTRELLVRPDVDSVAVLTSATLAAWNVPYRICDQPRLLPEAVTAMVHRARNEERPVAVLVTGAMA